MNTLPLWVLLLFLFRTAVTMTLAGTLHAGVHLLQQSGRFAAGLPCSLVLLLIMLPVPDSPCEVPGLRYPLR